MGQFRAFCVHVTGKRPALFRSRLAVSGKRTTSAGHIGGMRAFIGSKRRCGLQRMRVSLCLLASLVVGAWSTAGHAGPQQFGRLVYTLPDGWEAGDVEDGVLTIYSELPDARCDYCYMFLAAPVTQTGDLLQFLARNSDRFVEEDNRVDVEVTQAPRPVVIAGRDGAETIISANGHPYATIALPAANGIVLAGFRGDSGVMEESLETLHTDAMSFFASVDVVGGDGTSGMGNDGLLPPALPGDMDGIWWGRTLRQVLGVDGTIRLDTYHRILVFYPAGQFYDGSPPAGFIPLDRSALLDAADRSFGVYTHSGDRLSLTYADGARQTLTQIEGTWADEAAGLYLVQVEPLADGAPLDGTILSSFYSGAGTGAGMWSGSATVFTPDGSFTGASFGGAFGNVDAGGYSTGTGKHSGGTYRVQDSLVIMTPSEGPATAEFAFRTGEGILIGEQFLGMDPATNAVSHE